MRKLFLGVFILLIVASCAKKEGEDLTGFKDKSFDLWMAKYHPTATKLESGMYMEWIEQNPSNKKLNKGYWMKLNYTGRLMNGNIYVSRAKETVKQLGYFEYTTHFNPDYLPFYPSEIAEKDYHAVFNLALGQAEALKMMHEGDSVRLFLPGKLGYTYSGYNYSKGFSSGISVANDEAVMIDMKLAEIISEPAIYEKTQFERYAVDSMGVTDLSNHVVPGMYIQILEANPTGGIIDADSMISVHYTGKFIDGFIFDTNIDSVATKNHIYDNSSESKYEALMFKPTAESTMKEGFWRATLHMRKGERAKVIFLSSLGYGTEGSGMIQPYTPLVFELYVEGPKVN